MERPPTAPCSTPARSSPTPTGKRLFVADTGHNRIVQAGLDGKDAIAIGDGEEGFEDGPYEKARFNRPQGMFVEGDTLYVADTENHAIRAVDLKARQVATVAGTGSQMARMPAIPFSRARPDDALSQPLGRHPASPATRRSTSPWPARTRSGSSTSGSETVGVFAGSGYENILDGGAEEARFAQPSGLATDGDHLFVADSEVSGVRMITGRPRPRADRADDRRRRPVRVRRPRRHRRRGPAPALPGRGLRQRPPLHRRHLQQQDQGLRSRRRTRSTRWSARAQAGRHGQPAAFLRARRPERGRLRAVRRRHQQPQGPRGRPQDARGQDDRARPALRPRGRPRGRRASRTRP